MIKFEGNAYDSPSAWAIFCRRIANPGKKALPDLVEERAVRRSRRTDADQLKQRSTLSGHAR